MTPEWLGSPHLVDVALVVLVLEGALLWTMHRRGRGRLDPRDILGQLLAGGFLVGAVRNEMADGATGITLLLLAASFPAHLYDLVRRARAAPTR
jgi:hypothetical protein